MSLPPLLKHVYNHGTEEVIRRGKRIFHTSGVSMLDSDPLLEQIRFRVRNDLYQNYYTVTISKYAQPKNLSVRCQCPYNLGDICRHEVAALFQLNDLLQSGFFDNTNVTYHQQHTIVRMRQVGESMLRIFASPEAFDKAFEWATQGKAIITVTDGDRIEAEVPDGDETYKVVLRQNEERYFDTSCGCNEENHPLCVHKATLFLQVLKTRGAAFFLTLRNWDEQKNKLLSLYGYSLSDDLTNKFEFIYENGKPFLRVLDSSIRKIQPGPERRQEAEVTAAPAPAEDKRIGIVLNPFASWYPFAEWQLVTGDIDEEQTRFSGNLEKLELQQYIYPERFREEDRSWISAIRKFMPEEMLKYLRKNLPFGDFLDNYQEVLKELPAEEVKEQVWEYLLPKYQRLLERGQQYPLTFIRQDARSLSSGNIQPVAFSTQPAKPAIRVGRENGDYVLRLSWTIEGIRYSPKDIRMINPGLLLLGEKLYTLSSIAVLHISERFGPDGTLRIGEDAWPDFLRDTVLPWNQTVQVQFSDELVEKLSNIKPETRLYLQEREQMLLFFPAFYYQGTEIRWGTQGDALLPRGHGVRVIHRDEQAEADFVQLVRSLHTDIQSNARDHFFYLPSGAVLSNNWFFRFLDLMREKNVTLFGFEGLKNLRFNTHRPDTKVQVSSGIDWFDASIEISFGDQKVTIVDVKKALAQKQNFVRLGDGTLGLLPEEWLKKYALLVKMGESKNGRLRLKRFHFGVIDELLAEVDEEDVQRELEEKKERLTGIIESDFSTIPTPAELKATLRPYQQSGFQWLVFLREAGWGGILADDMGLGKTVQTLAFFQHLKNNDPEARFLVVCPTTLMYNWEKEIQKFTPGLRHYIHHGPRRTAHSTPFGVHDIIITTYGTMRSDIKLLREFRFEYVALDESQAIKNPQSQVAKAALLLNSGNRIALSGTPVQNNTFDLYAQMNFLNPGMLGSREFFMNEFATPIDKFQEDEVKQQLRKLIYPFLLRRTKEQVAKDLPEKTETILYCEMGHDQRRIYDAYRNSYKDQILGLIDEKGIERSQMHILQGLTKLRQICDSPAILNEAEKFGNHSIKLEELTREITENVGHHKALVFSQFLGMLALIRHSLEKAGIPYVYFDGSTSSTDREKAIEEFQSNDECRVFLISLKAGGIGLNLTAADYVYIVDPWWNPAVEQQAIDRTHRIGQTKNIFAYRLICKDSIEEKMLQLQERKRSLAQDLVTDDSAFLKRLTRDDIAFLLS